MTSPSCLYWADAVVMAQDGGAVGRTCPGFATGVCLRCKGGAIGARACQQVALVGHIAAALDAVAAFVHRCFLADVALVQMRHIAGDERSLGVEPRPMPMRSRALVNAAPGACQWAADKTPALRLHRSGLQKHTLSLRL